MTTTPGSGRRDSPRADRERQSVPPDLQALPVPSAPADAAGADAPRPRFALSKWHLDCVSDQGEVFIGDSALLSLHAIDFGYAGTIDYRALAGRRHSSWFGKRERPVLAGGAIHWCDPKIDISARWQPLAPPAGCRLYASARGNVDWECYPRTLAVIDKQGLCRLEGSGYAHHLLLTLKPWELPLSVLRWGRFVGRNDAVVWIEWQDRSAAAGRRTLVLCNGRFHHDAAVSDTGVQFGNGLSVRMEDRLILRNAPVLSTILPGGIALARTILPARIARMCECKWRSRATLRRHGAILSGGWVIGNILTLGGSPGENPWRRPG